MSPHHRLLDSVRGTKKTLYVVAAFYVVVGFFLAISAAIQGDRMGTFLGFIIISGALVTGALFRAVLRIGLRISNVGESLDDVATRLARIEHHGGAAHTPHEETPQKRPDRVIDLGESAPVDASLIAAATLDRKSFPRLADAMTARPPTVAGAAEQARPVAGTSRDPAATGGSHRETRPPTAPVPPSDAAIAVPSVASRNLLRTWKVALREGDLGTCRSVYAALVDTAEPPLVVRLSEQLESLARKNEQTLSERFAACVREQDYSGALAIGRDIQRLMPDRLIAEEYAALEAHLLRRHAQAERDDAPPLRLAH